MWISCAADPELEFAVVIAMYKPQRLMVPVLLRIRERPHAALVKGLHISDESYSSRQVMKGNRFGSITFDNVSCTSDDIMYALPPFPQCKHVTLPSIQTRNTSLNANMFSRNTSLIANT